MPPADDPLGAIHRAASSRVVAALAARFRDLDLAEEAYAEAVARAVRAWEAGAPDDPAAWLYRAATRISLDRLRRRRVRDRHAAAVRPLLTEAQEQEEAEEVLDAGLIPDERLRLIFVCCHPALGEEARIALTLKVVCRLETGEIARAFLVPEATLAQRLVRAKRKIADAGVPFEVPGPAGWGERLRAVVSTVEIAFAKAHEDAAASGLHAPLGPEMLALAALLAELLPGEPEVLALAAALHFAEARRPARIDGDGLMVPLAEQDPARWNRHLIARGDRFLARAFAAGPPGERALRAAIHGSWCRRPSLADPPPWPAVLALYDALLERRDDPFVRLNRAVALAEVAGPAAALAEVARIESARMAEYLPFHAARADLLARSGCRAEAIAAYDRALSLDPTSAERQWLEGRRAVLA